ncbi:MAG TPA: site-specific DNA-methyltransferase [Myxococcota bacterium]|nr:site-specific DNA-methyltransferase [Myxococcota bacterium]HRV17878.1 site-specific DNA-methyltransferase [Myxococcota bacterium]
METNKILQGDALEFLRTLPDASVHLFLFSPPYNLGNATSIDGRILGHYSGKAGHGKRGGNSKWRGGGPINGYAQSEDNLPWPVYIEWQHSVLAECWRSLSEDGAIYYNHKPRILANSLLDPQVFIPKDLVIRQRIIWQRSGGINFNHNYYLPTHEYIYLLAKEKFRLVDRGAGKMGDIWHAVQETNTWHPAPFPLMLAKIVLESVWPRLVVDPFCGSGTTAVAAKQLGIPYLCNELSSAYVAKATRRVERTHYIPPLELVRYENVPLL